MEPIQEPQRSAIINSKLLMVLIMSHGHPFIEVISAVHCRGLKEHDSDKSPECPYMSLKENGWEEDRNDIGD
jgi:hypothetical protein